MRVTVRGEGTEIRGYATIEALASLTSPPGEQPYVVIASPAEDDYNPFQISEPDYPPTLEQSRQIIADMMLLHDDPLEAIAYMHYMQATVIRGERGRAERAEKELLLRELHHCETEQINEHLEAELTALRAERDA